MVSLERDVIIAPKNLDAFPRTLLNQRLRTVEDVYTFFEFFLRGGSYEAGREPPFRFVYAGRVGAGIEFRPYDVAVVPRGRQPPNHFVISATAVVHVTPGAPSEVYLIQQWIRESQQFDRLRNLFFFKMYLKAKMLRRWLANVSQKKFIRNRALLAKRLFLSKATFAAPAKAVATIAFDVRLQQRVHDTGVIRGANAGGPQQQQLGSPPRAGALQRTLSNASEHGGAPHHPLSRKASLNGMPTTAAGANATLSLLPAVIRLVFYPDQRPQWGYTSHEFLEQQNAHFLKAKQHIEQYLRRAAETVSDLIAATSEAAGSVPECSSVEELEDVLAINSQVRGPPMGALYRQERDAERHVRKRDLKKRLVEYDLVTPFVRGADYALCQALFRGLVAATDMLQQHLELPHRGLAKELRLAFKLSLVFKDNDPIQFVPDVTEVQTLVRNFIADTVAKVSQLQRLGQIRDVACHMYAAGGANNKGASASEPSSQQLTVEQMIDDDEGFANILAKIAVIIDRDFAEAAERAKGYEACRACQVFVNIEWPAEFKTWPARCAERDRSKCLNESEVRRFVVKVNKHKSELQKLTNRHCGVLSLHVQPLVAELIGRLDGVIANIKGALSLLTTSRVEEVGKDLERKIATLNPPPLELRDFCEWLEQCAEVEAATRDVIIECNDVESLFSVADEYGFNFPQHQQEKRERTVGAGKPGLGEPLRATFLEAAQSAKNFQMANVEEIKQQLQLAVSDTTNILTTLNDELTHGDFKEASHGSQLMLSKLQQINSTIASLRVKRETLDKYAELLAVEKPAWGEFTAVVKSHEAKHRLWSTVARWEEKRQYWNRTPVAQIDGEKLREEMVELFQTSLKLHKADPDAVTDRLVNAITVERANMNVMVELCNPALKEEHWQQIFDAMGKRMVAPEARTLETLRTFGAYQQHEQISQVSGVATGEYVLVKQVTKIAQIWDTTPFVLARNRDSENYVLGGLDEIRETLEEHQIQIQTCLASRYVAGIRPQVEEWDAKLQLVGDVLEEWINVQKSWVYLEFVFASDDIKKQLPEESKTFAVIDKTFKALMVNTSRNNNVLAMCCEEGLLENLQKSTEHLEKIQKRLEDYLETKRAAFPRFYFLSNEELLSILSDVRNPMAVQPHLPKCFDSIKELEFEGTHVMAAMRSNEGEVVPFSEPVRAVGNVENWLNDIERMMRRTLYDLMKATVEAYSTEGRLEWYFKFPAQCIMSVDAIVWTGEMEEVWAKMGAGEKGALTDYLAFTKQQILNTVGLVKGALSKLQRTVVATLIVVDVHNRDVVQSLIDDKCDSSEDFNWQKQLRFYWKSCIGGLGATDCVIHHSAAQTLYGYEYLGNQPRLVITPLTERAYLTCTSALHIYKGAAPQGPAGTGKTESVKDLGKALARQVVVFNCSDGINYKTMSQMFAGFAQAGAWACFDEFNRIDLEVLSVIAQQMLEITTAIAARQDGMVFDGRKIRLNTNFGVFITMNPGYAGRTELPDNLKALFRPICMMIPDYALIAENMFFSEGFSDAKSLAQKMVRLYSLSSQQLSKQDHYDFGMRAVKSILVMAGSLKRAEPDSSEAMLLIRAMRDANVPKFLRDDTKLFLALINDLFPSVEIEEVSNPHLSRQITDELTASGLQVVPLFVEKIMQLYETMVVRHGVMLVGQTLTGKSTNATILCSALNALHAQGLSSPIESHKRFYNKTKVIALNPKSITMGEMYGDINALTRDWQDGVLSSIVRDLVKLTTPDRYWVTFDGPVDAIWIENMNSVLDDSKLLCLVNSERIKIPDTISIVFEVQDLRVASPATVSRCGMVYMENHYLDGGWGPIATSKSQKIAQAMATTVIKRTSIVPEAKLAAPKRQSIFAAAAADKAKADGAEPSSPAAAASPTDDGLSSPANNNNNGGDAFVKWDHTRLMELLEFFIPQCLAFIRAECTEYIATVDTQLVTGLLDLLHSALLTWLNEDDGDQTAKESGIAVPPKTPLDSRKAFDMLFIQSLIWAVGGNINDKSRHKFAEFLREKISVKMQLAMPPLSETVYDFFVHKRSLTWQPWRYKVPKFKYDPEAPYFELLVPTADTIILQYILGTACHVGKHVLVNGVTGTGKSSAVSNFVTNGLKSEDAQSAYAAFSITFSAQTGSNNLQETIESKLQRRRGDREIGPPPGKRMVCVIDDCNMPALEEYGASPPIELMRQMITQGGFYDRKKLIFKDVVDMILLCCCGEPGGGKNELTPRFVSNFLCLCITSLSAASMKTIFNGILGGFLESSKFPANIIGMHQNAVSATIGVYNRIAKEMLPTPEKTHYTFNLRDISKVVQGMLQVTPKECGTPEDFLKLWVHEASRVFHDRLIRKADADWWFAAVEEVIKDTFAMPVPQASSSSSSSSSGLRSILYGAFADKKNTNYKEITDQRMLHDMLKDYQTNYNTAEMKDMDLTFFDDAVAHLARICRILRQPRGNALLVGVGGSGRHSLCSLASFICSMDCRGIVIVRNYGVNEFRDDVKKLLVDCGARNKQIVFLLSDNQLIYSQMLEDINNLLNIGEVPGLMGNEEYDAIMTGCRDAVRAAGKPETRNTIYQFFVQRCRDNLHIILCMSPIGGQFRDRLRMFPSLVNCMTIDWYSAWPHDALLNVAQRSLAKVDLGSDSVKRLVCEMAVHMHLTVGESSEQMFTDLRRRNRTTPTSYLSLLNSYLDMYAEQLKKVADDVRRYQNGIDKLNSTNAQVETLKRRIREMQPVLARERVKAEEQQVQLVADQKEADVVKSEVSAEEEVARKLMDEAEAIKKECEDGLAAAIPTLRAAEAALDTLSQKDIQEIKVFSSPPPNVGKTLDAVLCLLGKKEGWASAKIELNNMRFLQSLTTFDRDNIPAITMRKLKRFIDDKEFVPDIIANTSLACKSLCMWVRAIDNYYYVARDIAPKRARLADAEAKVAAARAELDLKQGNLATIVQRLADLEREAKLTADNKARLEGQIVEAEAKLGRADQLLGGLSSESARWQTCLVDLREERTNVVGTMCLAAGAIAYLGPFTAEYRAQLLENWTEKAKALQIPCAGDFSLEALVGPYLIREWALQGLPSDNFSIENGAILQRSKAFCFMIDPQGQANQYIRRKEAKNKLKVVKLSDENYMRVLESAMLVGAPVLMENVGEELDAALDPILKKETVNQGGRYVMKLGDKECEYDPNFRLYITTKLPNPTLSPELQIKVNVINFTVTRKGLEDQQLGDVVAFERRDLQEKSDQCVVAIAKGRAEIKKLEDTILRLLAESTGDILDNIDLIDTLSQSKQTSDTITKDLEVVEATNDEIQKARENYRVLATRGSLIYKVISELANVDPMYQYSLQFFKKLFNATIAKTAYDGEAEFEPEEGREYAADEEEALAKARIAFRQTPAQVSHRIATLIPAVTWTAFSVVCRGLFEKDKLLYSFLITVAFQRHADVFKDAEWNAFLRGGAGVKIPESFPPKPTWLDPLKWLDVCGLAVNVPQFAGLEKAIARDLDWRSWVESDAIVSTNPPTPLADISVWERALLVKVLRPDRFVLMMRLVVEAYLGTDYTVSPQFSLKDSYADSNNMTPLIFVLSTGTDPTVLFTQFADEMGFGDRKLMLSLGQDQGRRAQQMIEEGRKDGLWVYLQNCHVYVSWMPQLERIVEAMRPEETHPEFRLWLTSNPSPAFPVPVLQSGMKLTREPPKGLKANLKDFVHSLDEEVWDEYTPLTEEEEAALKNPNAENKPFARGAGASVGKEKEWKRLIFTLAFFHALVQERRKFGALGWNIPYDWNAPDLAASIGTLRICMNDFGALPWTAIQYIIGVINYGGRVTDFLDQRCLQTICGRFFVPTLTTDEAIRYDSEGVYGPPSDTATKDELIAWVDSFPQVELPEVFGLHANADISCQSKEAALIISTLIEIQPSGGGGGGGGGSGEGATKSQDQIIYEMAEDLLKRLPEQIDVERAHPSCVEVTAAGTMISLGTVMLQEVDQFNRLLRIVEGSLKELRRAIKGEVVMSATMEAMFSSFTFNLVPKNWRDKGYLSLKPLSSYFSDLIARIDFMRDWCYNGMPKSFWVSGLFFPQGFITGVYQTHSRLHGIPIDRIKFKFNPLQNAARRSSAAGTSGALPSASELPAVASGVYVHGFFLDGAAWRNNMLQESTPGQLFDALPPIHLEPVLTDTPNPPNCYECPLYKVSTRAGVLSTTGVSTNFILQLQLPSPPDVPPSHWINRGVGALCMLDN